jgi:hypothetical protein
MLKTERDLSQTQHANEENLHFIERKLNDKVTFLIRCEFRMRSTVELWMGLKKLEMRTIEVL